MCLNLIQTKQTEKKLHGTIDTFGTLSVNKLG